MADYPNARDCEHGRLRRSCERCSDAFLIAALEARLAEVEAERDQLGVLYRKADAGRRTESRRLAEVEQALREYGEHTFDCDMGCGDYDCTCGLSAVLDKREPE